MRRRALGLLAMILTLVAASNASADDPAAEKADVDARIAALRAEIAASRAREGVLTSQLSAVASELRGAESAVDQAEATVSAVEAELSVARMRLDEFTTLLARQTGRLVRLRGEYVRAVEILEARMRSAYIDGQPDMLAFLVSASSFDEVIDSVELVTRINRQDRRIAGQVERARDRAAAERRATADTRRLQAATVSVIASRDAEARDARDRLAQERDRLASVEALEQSALASTRETRDDYLREVEALAAESAALAARIRGAQDGAGTTGDGQPSAAGLIWPCAGAVVSGFGLRWGRMHDGVDIDCSYGTPVHAAAAGTVIYAGWLGGYGNLVVLDHGNGLATAYAHASSILVAVGETVAQGQTVTLVGSTGHSTGPHLHFEVRVNGVAVDPLGYL